jgi:GDP-4-dehydro-6-deoxy-D-mannose reductase
MFFFQRKQGSQSNVSTVLVTGASGFIGKALVTRLISNGHEVIEFNHSNGDIADSSIIASLPMASHVVHLAGRHFVPDSWTEPAEFLRVNLLGTQNIIDYCLKHGSKLVYSSAYLYGIPKAIPIKEDHILTPNNPYALSKYFGENLIEFFSNYKDLSAITLRLFNVYGHGQKNEYLIPSILDQIAKDTDIQVNNLLPSRDYVYIEDVVDAIILAMNCDHKYEIFNIGSGISYSVKELIEISKTVTGSDAKIVSRELYRKNEIMDVVADCESAHEKLNWAPKYTLEQGLHDIWSKKKLS